MRNCWVLFGIGITLSGCGSGYQIEKGKPVLVSWNAAVGRHSVPLKDADASTFKVLLPGKFARDSRHVYYETVQVEDADVDSFAPLKDKKDKYNSYSKDKNHVYMHQFVIADADPNSFQLLTYPFARDDKHVFCGTELVPTENVDKFQILLGNSMISMSGPIDPDDDEATKRRKRQIKGQGWATDGKFVFCGAKKIEGADYESFRPQDESRAKDKNRSYKSLDFLIDDFEMGDANQEAKKD